LEELVYFQNSIENYFNLNGFSGYTLTNSGKISLDNNWILDLSSLVEIKGKKNGNFLISSTWGFAEILAKQLLMVDTVEKQLAIDMVGEFSNIISGNISQYLPYDYNIHPPRIFNGKKDTVISTLLKLDYHQIAGIYLNHKFNVIVGLH
jgi:CheY-specific phosphatase CheX